MSTLVIGSHPAVASLALVEARRQLTGALPWLGVAGTVLLLVLRDGTWAGEAYQMTPMAVLPLCLCALVAGYRIGSRDHGASILEAVPLGVTGRARARLVALAVYPTLAASVAVGVAVASRIDGGFWMGEGRYRTDSALHPVSELAQLPLLVALAAVSGLAISHRARHPVALAVVATVVWLTMAGLWWVVNVPPIHALSPVQSMPLEVDIGSVLRSDVDPDWFVVGPNEFTDQYRRQVVHQPTILGHDLYLTGWIAVLGAVVLRGRRLLVIGVGGVVAGVLVQLLVMPAGLV